MKVCVCILLVVLANAFGRKYGGGNKGSGLYPHSGSSSGEGSDEIDKCSVLGFSELLTSFRAFPHDPTTEMYGYDPIVYEPLLDEFWIQKDVDGFDIAIRDVGTKFATRLFTDRYQCKGTQFNQLLISIIERNTDKYILKMQTPLMQRIKWVLEKLHDADLHPLDIDVIPQKIVYMINRTMHHDVIGYLEKTEFEGVACFMEYVRDEFEKEIENGATLDEIKVKFMEYAADYPSVFTCTRPVEVIDIYTDGWVKLTKPRGEKSIIGHLKHELRNILDKVSDDKKDMRRARRHIIRRLMHIVHRFIISVVKPMRPVLDIVSKDEMVEFLEKHLPEDRMDFAERLIQKLHIYTTGTGTTMWPHTPESYPRIPNTNWPNTNGPNTAPNTNWPTSDWPKASTYYPVSYYSTGPTTDSTVSNYPTTGASRSAPYSAKTSPPVVVTTLVPNLDNRLRHLEKIYRRFLQRMHREYRDK